MAFCLRCRSVLHQRAYSHKFATTRTDETTNMINIENLTKVFETGQDVVTAADHITMQVPEGEICVLLGPSGCGKTTTLKMVNRIVTPTSGRVLINGEDTTQQDTVTLRRNIGYVIPVSYTHLRAHETDSYLVCRLLLEK